MKYYALIAALTLTISSAIFGQGPALPELPPQPTPVPPVPKLVPRTEPMPTEARKVPQPTVEQVSPLVPPVPMSEAAIQPVQPAPVVAPQSIQSNESLYQTEYVQPTPASSTTYPPAYEYHSPSSHTYQQTIIAPQPMQQTFVVPQYSYYPNYTAFGNGVNPAGAEGVYVGPAISGGEHQRFPLYDYRRPWYTRGPASRTVDIVW